MGNRQPSVTLAFARPHPFRELSRRPLDRKDRHPGPMSLSASATPDAARAQPGERHPRRAPACRKGADTDSPLLVPQSAIGLGPPVAIWARRVSLAQDHGRPDDGAAGLRHSPRAAREVRRRAHLRGPDHCRQRRPAPTRSSVNGASRWPCWPRTPHLWRATPRSGMSRVGSLAVSSRLHTCCLAAVRAANAHSDVVVVYLHWGAEGRGRPHCRTTRTRPEPGQCRGHVVCSACSADVPLGAGMLDNTYVSYGLGNFLCISAG